jgi:predicted Zn-dependent protease with MMP-like domain
MSRLMEAGQTAAWGSAPDAEAIELLARAAIARLPDIFRDHLGDVVLRIEEFADDETLHALGIGDPFQLSGLYHGRPVGEKSISDNGALPDMITLYRRALLDEWIEAGETLENLVTHVLVHEVGHHFGLSDEDMHALEESAGP